MHWGSIISVQKLVRGYICRKNLQKPKDQMLLTLQMIKTNPYGYF